MSRLMPTTGGSLFPIKWLQKASIKLNCIVGIGSILLIQVSEQTQSST